MWKCITLLGILLFLIQCSDEPWDQPPNEPVHLSNWLDTQFLKTKDFHGTVALEQGTEVCEPCHGIDLTGKEGVFGCYHCHFGPNGSRVPENADWQHGQDRHMEFETDQAVCNVCHDVERSFGTGPPSCHDCHGDGETHVLGQPWLDRKSPDFHATGALDTCANCHDVDEKCSECHFGETGSKSPPGSSWVHDGDGDNEDHRSQEPYVITCNQCHKVSRSYSNGPPSCHNCHEEEDD